MKIAIIDFDTALYLACHNKKEEPLKTFEDCCKEIDENLLSILENTDSSHYLIYLTVGKCFRYDYNKEYKAKRSSEKPPFFKELRDYIINKNPNCFYIGLEADDLCVITKKHFEEQGINCFIASIDKDLLSLEGVSFNLRKMEWKNTTKEEANLFFWKSMVCGDTVDGVFGLKGKGEKFFEKLYQSSLDHEITIPIESLVFYQYIKDLGEEKGIEEFYKNYKSLKILDSKEGFEIPTPIEFKPVEEVPQIEEDLPEFDF